MSCSTFDLKGYLLGEVPPGGRTVLEAHVASCTSCREELERLRHTQSLLWRVPDEEIPRRLVYVSDKLSEPRWWRRLWDSGPRLGFASAAMLTAAILVHAFVQPAPPAAPASIDTATIRAAVDSAVREQLETAVIKAVGDSESRQAQKTARLLAAAEQRFQMERQADRLQVQETFDVLRKRFAVMHLASVDRER